MNDQKNPGCPGLKLKLFLHRNMNQFFLVLRKFQVNIAFMPGNLSDAWNTLYRWYNLPCIIKLIGQAVHPGYFTKQAIQEKVNGCHLCTIGIQSARKTGHVD